MSRSATRTSNKSSLLGSLSHLSRRNVNVDRLLGLSRACPTSLAEQSRIYQITQSTNSTATAPQRQISVHYGRRSTSTSTHKRRIRRPWPWRRQRQRRPWTRSSWSPKGRGEGMGSCHQTRASGPGRKNQVDGGNVLFHL
jgi:hypothetical protein